MKTRHRVVSANCSYLQFFQYMQCRVSYGDSMNERGVIRSDVDVGQDKAVEGRASKATAVTFRD